MYDIWFQSELIYSNANGYVCQCMSLGMCNKWLLQSKMANICSILGLGPWDFFFVPSVMRDGSTSYRVKQSTVNQWNEMEQIRDCNTLPGMWEKRATVADKFSAIFRMGQTVTHTHKNTKWQHSKGAALGHNSHPDTRICVPGLKCTHLTQY